MPMLEEMPCVDCDEQVLPVVAFDDCEPEFNKSEITRIFIALPDAEDFTDEADPEEWALRLSQNSTPPTPPVTDPVTPPAAVKDLIRELTVIADKPLPTESTYTGSNNRTVPVDRQRLINVTIDETNDANYDLMRSTECGIGLPVKVWYIHGGYLYGGKTGLKGGIGNAKYPILKLQEQLDRGGEGVAVFNGTLAWNNLKSERRVPSPFL